MTALADSVKDFVEQFGVPAVVSLDPQTHIFHFQRDGAWHDGDIAFVNRNGNFFRIIRQPDGGWLHAKTWRGFEPQYDWEIGANLRREDPQQLIALTGIGDQRNNARLVEGLSLLPREATKSYRFAAYRSWLARVSFQRDNDTFQLHLGSRPSPVISGKPWESAQAAVWMREETTGLIAPGSASWAREDTKITYLKQPNRLIRDEAVEVETTPAWGMFG